MPGHFLHHYARVFQKTIDAIEPETMAVLRGYPWPGNVRELENVIQRCIILARGRTLHLENLPATLRENAHTNFEAVPGGTFERQLHDYKVASPQRPFARTTETKPLRRAA